MTGRRRVGAKGYSLSLEERVWRWLKRQGGPTKLAAVREHFSLDKAAASHCLRRLTWKGSVVRVGVTHTVTYTATDTPPEDLRGTAPGTLLILKKYHPQNRQTSRLGVRF